MGSELVKTRLITTPHPVVLDGQTNIAAELQPREMLGPFLRRTVPGWADDAWEVRINGVVVPHEVMDRVRPKSGAVIEVRGLVKKQALYIVAFAVLTYFTFGVGSAAAGAWGAGAAAAAFGGGLAGALFASAVFAAGSILINKVLGPKPPGGQGGQEQDQVYSISAGRNQVRAYQPLPIVFGTVKYAPDVISAPYTWYEGESQYLGMVLTPGIGAHSVEPMLNGDALLSAYEGVRVYHSGFGGMPDEDIPLYSNANTVTGGELDEDQTWVVRTTPADTVRIQINIEYILGDQDSKGRPYTNHETVQVEYSPAGSGTWSSLASQSFSGSSYDQKRATISRDVVPGQYDVRVRILGQAMNGGGSNGRSQWQWATMTAVQSDNADYAGIPRIGVRIKATGQLNGTPDELRCVVHSAPIPVWDGSAWSDEETSNPGAHLLKYARGYFDDDGNLIAGIGLADDMIDIAALQAFMLHCADKSFTYDYVIRDARSHEEMVSALALAGFGQVTWAGGRFSVVWAADDQPISAVANMATIKKGEFQVDYTLANAADGIEFTYYDASDWTAKTIRVPAPGVTTMLNPASVTGEGITSEAHAAKMARWHLAQSLYQYKDISFNTDIEHLTYQRLSLLSLSHDLTQWGFSGRLRGVEIAGSQVTVHLDEPVRAPTTGTAYIGLRIPGERTYRVFPVQSFEGESDALVLTGEWPDDAPVPGDSAGNPAHDTVWCYDFKPTPGYRVRVVSIEPENNLKGARVAVVPESEEYWNYVNTGTYIPSPGGSLLPERPVASGLTVEERQRVQGDTVFTELVARFEVSGPVRDVVVLMSGENGELEEVARTTARTATWRIPGAGSYSIVVRPFTPDGREGVAASIIYNTVGADVPPVLVDLFDVAEQSGGVRLYTWGWLSGTTQSADFAGVEIRYIAGNVPSPDWDSMSPVGDDGFHTAAFEAVIPEAGEWTFAARSRNTSGQLSTGMRVITRTLGANLGEQLSDIDQRLIEEQARIDQEILDRAQEDLRLAGELGELALRQSGLEEAIGSAAWDEDAEYPEGSVVNHDGRVYFAVQDVPEGIEPPDPAYWEDRGSYDSTVIGQLEAVGVRLTQAETNISDIDGELTAETLAREALGVRVGDAESDIVTERTARIDGDSVNASAIQQVAIDLGGVQASVTEVAEVVGSARIVSIPNASFEQDTGWGVDTSGGGGLPANVEYGTSYGRGATRGLRIAGGADTIVHSAARIPVMDGERLRVGGWIARTGSTAIPAGGSAQIGVRFYDAAGAYISGSASSVATVTPTSAAYPADAAQGVVTAPAGAATMGIYVRGFALGTAAVKFDDIFAERISQTDAKMMARHTVALDVNGNISGTVNENDGVRSSFTILADVFQVAAPGGGARTAFSNGNWRVYDASGTLRVRMGVW